MREKDTSFDYEEQKQENIIENISEEEYAIKDSFSLKNYKIPNTDAPKKNREPQPA